MSGVDAPVLVIGAGPAGLATSRELRRRRVEHLVLEQGASVGHSWENLYDSLRLHTGKHLSTLPGLRYPRSVPLFPTRRHFIDYLHRYVARFEVPVRTDCEVRRVERRAGGWTVATGEGESLRAHALVVATGIVASPRRVELPGRERFRGRVFHSVAYRRPDGYAGRRVLVVGAGNSGGEIASELAAAGAEVAVAVRSGANVVPLSLLGVPIQYVAYALRGLPRPAKTAVVAAVRRMTEIRRGPPVLPPSPRSPLDAIPLLGFHLVDAIRAGRIRVRPGVRELTEAGVRFEGGTEEPFDEVILATGFTAAIGMLEGLVGRDEKGFARRRDRVTAMDQSGLYFVGHNYDATGGLSNIRRDARLAAARVAREIRGA